MNVARKCVNCGHDQNRHHRPGGEGCTMRWTYDEEGKLVTEGCICTRTYEGGV